MKNKLLFSKHSFGLRILFSYWQDSAIDQLKSKVKIIFGTDSTLTASWTVWNN